MTGALGQKVLVILGGTAGLGLSAAQRLVKEGARVVVVGRHAGDQSGIDLPSDACRVLLAEATAPETAPKAVALAVEHFGAFHGLYHVAGGSGRRMGDGPLHELTDEGWRYTCELNATSVFYSNRAAVRQFLSQGTGGSVLNLSSVLSYSPAPRFFSTHAYTAAKASIIGLTTACAAYYAPQGIRFNVLTPGLVATPMSQRAQSDPAIMDYIKTKQSLDGGRIGCPEDLDAAAVFFLSDASKFVTGQVLAVDGGWSVSEGQAKDQK